MKKTKHTQRPILIDFKTWLKKSGLEQFIFYNATILKLTEIKSLMLLELEHSTHPKTFI
jgi:hypothetical protein